MTIVFNYALPVAASLLPLPPPPPAANPCAFVGCHKHFCLNYAHLTRFRITMDSRNCFMRKQKRELKPPKKAENFCTMSSCFPSETIKEWTKNANRQIIIKQNALWGLLKDFLEAASTARRIVRYNELICRQGENALWWVSPQSLPTCCWTLKNFIPWRNKNQSHLPYSLSCVCVTCFWMRVVVQHVSDALRQTDAL